MIVALAVALLAAAGGSLATYAFDRAAPLHGRVAAGTYLGLTTLAVFGLVLALVFGLGPVAIGLAMAVTLSPALLLRSSSVRSTIGRDVAGALAAVGAAVTRPTLGTVVTVLYGTAAVAGTWLVADRTFFEGPDGLSIGNVNNLGDLPYHVQITASFAYGSNFPPDNPVFAGSGFSYHYLADFLAAILVAAGATLVEGMFIVSMLLGLALLGLVHRWTRDLTRSAVAARLAPLLLVFSGGLGWVLLLEEARVGERGIVEAFIGADTRYTIVPDGVLRFGNAVTTLLIPQRGLLLGIGLAIIVFGLLWRHLDEPSPGRGPGGTLRQRIRTYLTPRMVVAGVVTGLLPIIHVHTFAVVFGTAFLWGVVFREWRDSRWRPWALYVLTSLAVALPTLAWTARGTQANPGAFFGLQFGWEAGAENPIWFWFVNTGLFIPLLVAAFAWRFVDRPLLDRKLLLYALPFVAWFIVPNVFRLAPWLWDNIKVLVYWWLGAVPIVALVLARLWEGRRSARVAAVGLAVVLTAAGALDVARATVGRSYQEFDPDGIAFAERIREVTPPRAVILTAPSWNTPVYLTGRQVFMGYAGFLWANGLPFVDREQDVRTMYAGGPTAVELLRINGIRYIVLGPHETREVDPNEEFIGGFRVVAEVGEYSLHEVELP